MPLYRQKSRRARRSPPNFINIDFDGELRYTDGLYAGFGMKRYEALAIAIVRLDETDDLGDTAVLFAMAK